MAPPCGTCGRVKKALEEKEAPTLKEKLTAGTVLDGYIEATRVKPLTEIFEENKDTVATAIVLILIPASIALLYGVQQTLTPRNP